MKLHPIIARGRDCVRCGQNIPWTKKACGHFSFFSCMECHPIVASLFKDYSKSKRGRKRTKAELLQAIARSRETTSTDNTTPKPKETPE